MIDLTFELQPCWPKLAWVAILNSEDCSAKVLHGPMVEIFENWAVEAVWDGDFNKGDFDNTDLVFGTGIHKRGDRLIFVSSASASDRLWYVHIKNRIVVSNTLPGLLSVSGLSLLDNYPFYASDIATIELMGLYRYKKNIPSNGPGIGILYFSNMVWEDGHLKTIEKPDCCPRFQNYTMYKKYLESVARNIGMNASSKARSYQIDMLTGLSTGYDSVATSIISKYAGCNKAVSIEDSSSFWRGADSGVHIANRIGIDCDVVKHDKKKYHQEIFAWAATGNPGGRNMQLFSYPKPLCLFFSGNYGDTIWNKQKQGLIEPKGSTTGFSEYRLFEGFFVTVVPWWGIRHAAEIQKINHLEEMQPWTLWSKYDRPIARRLAEEAGVERGTFAIRKKDTASNEPFWWPSTKEAIDSFCSYLILHKIKPIYGIKLKVTSVFCKALKIVYRNFFQLADYGNLWKPWEKHPSRSYLFIWANHTIRDTYYKL